MKKKIAFYTMGCKLNYAETSTISRKFSDSLYQKVSFKSFADIYIINSCSVTNNAEIEFQRIVRYAKNQNAKSMIVAIGCYAQLNPEKVYSVIGVDLVLGYEEKFHIIEYLHNERVGLLKNKIFSKIRRKNYNFFPSFSVGDRTRSFLKIQDGCDYKCSYCIIPMSRGPSRSERIENILKNIDILLKKGVKEIVLTGINIGDYRVGQRRYKFFDLINIIEEDQRQRTDKVRIRLSSIEPNLLTKECIEFVSKSQCFVPHFHIPLQSGSNEILRKMHRRYKRELYQEKIHYIRDLLPHAYIGSDVIVGFPGETHENFLETYLFLKTLDISSMHIFSYSPRPKTKSMMIPEKISRTTQKKRSRMLRLLSNKKYRLFCTRQIFKKKTVLFEKIRKHHPYIYGYTENYIRIKIHRNELDSSKRIENTLQKVYLKQMDKDNIMIAEMI